MQPGTDLGFGDNLTGLRPIQGGQWNGGQGRLTSDEHRAFSFPSDNIPGADTGGTAGKYPGGQRTVNIPRQLNVFFPGDTGSIFNACNGNFVVTGAVAPFSSAFNAAGTFTFTKSSTANFSILENNQVYQTSSTTGGAGINLPFCSTVVASPLYVGGVSGTTVTETLNEIESSTNFSGTIVVTRHNNYEAFAQALNAAVITTRAGYHVRDTTVTGGGTQGTMLGLDVDPLVSATTNIGARFFATSATYTVAYPTAILVGGASASVTAQLNFTNASFGTLISVAGTFQLNQTAAGLTMGTAIGVTSIIKNQNGTTANMGLGSSITAAPTFQADNAGITGSTQIIFGSGPTVNVINGGTLSMTALRCYNSSPTVSTGATVTTLAHINITAAAGSGTVTTEVGVDIAALRGTTPIGVRLAATPNPLQIAASATGPTTGNLTSNTNAVFTVYFGGTNYYFLIAWNDAGTVRYKYMLLSGSTTPIVWTNGTTLPT